jgi:hypothetical protein
MPTPANVAGAARRRQPGFDKGFGDGVDLCWLDPQAIPGVVPANAKRAVTADARAQATAGEGMTIRAGCSRWTMMPTGSSKRGAPNVNSPPVSVMTRFEVWSINKRISIISQWETRRKRLRAPKALSYNGGL